MSLTCIIVDDEYLAIEILSTYLCKMEDLQLSKSFTDPTAALEYLQTNCVDILFLDVQMPEVNGFELLRKLTKPPAVIFTTARHDYAAQAYELDVIDYLVKPIPFERFQKSIQKAKEYVMFRKSNLEVDFLLIKADYQMHKIMFTDILFIEGLSEYVKIHTAKKTFIPLLSLKDLTTQLPTDRFVRIHKSFIVSIPEIASFTRQQVELKNGKLLPVGRSHKTSFFNTMSTAKRMIL